MTLAEAKRLYIAAVQDVESQDAKWWQEVREEMESIVAARSDRAAGKLIEWWCDWDRELSATKQARLIREEWARMES